MDVQEKLKALKALYAKQLPVKFQEIETQWDTLQKEGWNPEGVKNLVQLTHQLIGTSGSFGFGTVSGLARTIEEMLKGHLENPQASDEGLLAEVADKIGRLKQACARPD